jgi:nucleoside-diphosphate-sugar epimerase
MRVLVLGGLGDVGRAVLKQLARSGHTVRCLDLRTPRNVGAARRFRHRGVDIAWGDVRCQDTVAHAVAGQDAIVHLAAVLPPRSELQPELTYSVNVRGTRNVVEAAQASTTQPRLIYVSSLAVFGRTGDAEPPRTATDPVQPFDHYTRSKVAAEDVVRASSAAWAILRLGVVVPIGRIGRDPRLMVREMFEVPLDQRIECVHSRDVARAVAAALTCPDVLGRTLLIGGGRSCQMLQREFLSRTLAAVGLGPLPTEAFGAIPYHTDWLDTCESQSLLEYQTISFEDFLCETRRTYRPLRGLVRAASPVVRWWMLRQSPFLGQC